MALRQRWLADTTGTSSAEYALLLAIVGGALAIAALTLSKEISCSMTNASLLIEGEGIREADHPGHSDPQGEANGHDKSCEQ